jgi:hypothetical protein
MQMFVSQVEQSSFSGSPWIWQRVVVAATLAVPAAAVVDMDARWVITSTGV